MRLVRDLCPVPSVKVLSVLHLHHLVIISSVVLEPVSSRNGDNALFTTLMNIGRVMQLVNTGLSLPRALVAWIAKNRIERAVYTEAEFVSILSAYFLVLAL